VSEQLEALADDLAALLATAGPLPCDQLAKTLRRRRCVVLAALREDERFEHEGEWRRSRWRLTDETACPARRDGLDRDAPGELDHRVGLDGREVLRA
jgi:hypothetical protein